MRCPQCGEEAIARPISAEVVWDAINEAVIRLRVFYECKHCGRSGETYVYRCVEV